MRSFVVILLLSLTSIAGAHPMGNFSINHYSALSLEEKGLKIEYIIDLAEIPTFQEMEALDLNHDKQVSVEEGERFARSKATEFTRNLTLSIDGKILRLKPVRNSLHVVPGAGGLPTLVIRTDYFADLDGGIVSEKHSVVYKDENFPDRIGWKEIVIRKGNSISFSDTTRAHVDRSKELTEYPQDATMSPPQEIMVAFDFQTPAGLPAASVESQRTPTEKKMDQAPGAIFSRKGSNFLSSTNKKDDAFTRLISAQNLTGKVIFFSLLVAFFLGAMHALSPGHGKAIVAGYLVGSRGTALHAVFLGAVVTLTHTIGVFALGILTLFGSRYILPETLYPWLGFLSGLSIVVIGLSLFRKRFNVLRKKEAGSFQNQAHVHHLHSHDQSHSHSQDHHDHDHGHSHNHPDDDHSHPNDHSHLPVDKTGSITWRSLLTVGISGGALPCPSALVVLLSAISLHRIGFGLLLILSFSLGLALVLTSIGVLFVYASGWTQKFRFSGQLVYRMPLVSSLVISILGFAIAIQALLRV